MSKITYINPEFQEMLDFVPKHVGRKVDLSFDIAKRIYDILKRKGWSQADLAKAAGKKEAEISKWMSGHHNFTIGTIAFIESVLGEGIISVKQYRSSKGNEVRVGVTKSPYRSRNHSAYAPGRLNEEGEEYVSEKKTEHNR